MTLGLAELCSAHGIETTFTGVDGIARAVAPETLSALVDALGISEAPPSPPPTIAEVRRDLSPPRCHVPNDLESARLWGITCQVSSLASSRNAGIGDFADLAALCRIAAAEGADFVGVNPLHALFWSDPNRISPFYPSNRRFLNPLYLALDWIDGFAGLNPDDQRSADMARAARLVDFVAVMPLKDQVLRDLFRRFPWSDQCRVEFGSFCEAGGDPLMAHATFEAISAVMSAKGRGPLLSDWPELLRDSKPPEVALFARQHEAELAYHCWLQWLARRQLDRVQREARAAGMRIGLYLDCAVGAAPDGSAAWADPHLTVPGLSVGSPPDPFSLDGQDWGLAPLSPVRLAALDGRPLADVMTAVMQSGGAVRIDHAMGIARLWLIPRGMSPTSGAYVRYPLSLLLERLAETSRDTQSLVIGEDLGVVPDGFRALLSQRAIHSYKVLFFERDGSRYVDPGTWPMDALACVATHDMPTFAGWWEGADLTLRQSLGLLGGDIEEAREERKADRRALQGLLGTDEEDVGSLSVRLHALVAASPCRLAVLQIEDALGLTDQINLPGTVTEYPNWRRRLPVAVGRLVDDPSFKAHTSAMRQARPK